MFGVFGRPFSRKIYLSSTRCVASRPPANSFGFAKTGPKRTKADICRPFRILGVQQVAIGCRTREPLDLLWKSIFGLEPHATKRIESENVEEDILKLGIGPHEVEIDLMTPIDDKKTPKVHAPPLNHIGLWVDRLEEAVEWMEEQGVRFTPGGIRKGAAGHNVVFIHPKGIETAPISGNGVLIELVQAPENVIVEFNSNESC